MANAILCRPLPFTVLSSGNATAAGPASNLNNDRMGRAWQCSGTTNCYVVIDLGSAQTIDTVALLASNANAADTVRLRGAATSAAVSGTSPPGAFLADQTFSAVASTDGNKRVHRNGIKTFTGVSARYWRIDVTTTNTAFSAGRLVLGSSLAAADNVDYGWDFEVVDLGKIDDSTLGIDDIRIGAKVLAYHWTWSWLTETEARGSLLDILAYAGTTRPILLCLDPAATDAHNLIGYGQLVESVKGTNYLSGTYDAQFGLRSRLVLSL